MEQTTTQATGADARAANEVALAAAREEAVQAERGRISEIQALGVTAIKYGIDETVTAEFITKGVSVDQARKELFVHLSKTGQQGVPPRAGVAGPEFPVRGEGGTSVTRDGLEQRLACMQMALLLRADGRFTWRGAGTTTAMTPGNISMATVPNNSGALLRWPASTAISSSSTWRRKPWNCAARTRAGWT